MPVPSIRSRPCWASDRPHYDNTSMAVMLTPEPLQTSSWIISTPTATTTLSHLQPADYQQNHDISVYSITNTPRQVSFEDGHSDAKVDEDVEGVQVEAIPHSSCDIKEDNHWCNSGRKRSLMRRPKTSLSLVDLAKSDAVEDDDIVGADDEEVEDGGNTHFETEENCRRAKRLCSPSATRTPSTSHSLFSNTSPKRTDDDNSTSDEFSSSGLPWGHFIDVMLPEDTEDDDSNGDFRFSTPLSYYNSTVSPSHGPSFPAFLPSTIQPSENNCKSGMRRSTVASSSSSRTKWSRHLPRYLHLTNERFSCRSSRSTAASTHRHRSDGEGRNEFRLLPRHLDSETGSDITTVYFGPHESLIGAFSGLGLDCP